MTQLEQLPARIDGLTLQVSQLRSEVSVEFSAVRREIAEQGLSLRAQISDLATHMRVLHEDVISRIAQSQDGWSGPTRRRPKNK